jgi:hypothetical protein
MQLKLTLEEFIALAYEALRNDLPRAHWPDEIRPAFMKTDRDGERDIVEQPKIIYIDLPDKLLT